MEGRSQRDPEHAGHHVARALTRPLKRARRLRAASAATFALQFAALDVAIRGHSAGPLALAASVCAGALVLTARDARVRFAAAILAGVLFAVQATFARYWHVAIDRQIAASALHNFADVRAVLAANVGRATALVLAAVAAEIALVLAAGDVAVPGDGARARVRGALAAALIAALAFGPPLRAATPELAAIDAVLDVARHRVARADEARARPDARAHDDTPVAVARAEVPNVVFVLTESVRASDACSAPGEACETMHELDALFPDRVPLRELRAISSYTAVSLSALVTGRTQTGDRHATLEAPTVFELVRRVHGGAGAAVRPHVAYWSAQMGSVFERDDVASSVDSFVSVETLLGHAIEDDDQVVDRGVDRLLVERALRDLDALPEPFFLFVHLSGTHAPYFVDPARAPFSPWSHVVSWSTLPELHNAYKNAIVAQDAAVAELLRRVVAKSAGSPLVVLYTSDHGEAFGEHAAIHHGQDLYDEQIHVPGFVVARGGALDDAQLANLRAHERSIVTHLDLLPTMLDVYGALGAFGLRDAVRAMPGRSLLAPPRALVPLPMTNCTALFPCPLNAWGMLGEGRALSAQAWDHDWHCTPLGASPAPARSEEGDDDACRALRMRSHDWFATLPSGAPNR